MRSYKTYLVFIFVPYTVLVIMFHQQLPLYEGTSSHLGGGGGQLDLAPPPEQGSRSREAEGAGPAQHRDKSYRFRDLMLNEAHKLHVEAEVHREQRVPAVHSLDPPLWPANASSQAAPRATQGPASPLTNMEMHVEPRNQSLVHQSEEGRLSNISTPVARGCAQPEGVQFQTMLGHYIYSGYYDARQPERPSIRVIALLKKIDKPLLYCHLPTSRTATKDQQTYVTSMANYYEMCENHAKDYGGWIISCEVPLEVHSPPCEVVLSLRSSYKAADTYDVTVPVFVTDERDSTGRKRDFGVCIPPLFGHIPSTTLVEFIELTQILGAVHFTFYVHEVSLEMTKVLRYYGRSGLVSIIPWELPVRSKAIWYHGQLLAINDCLYRNMHAFHYVAFNDIDEFIVPHRMSNWSSMVQQLLHPVLDPTLNSGVKVNRTSTSHNFCGFTFQSAFFDPLLMGSSTGRILYDLESDLRTKLFSKVRTKAMVDPSRIFELGIHHISKPLLDDFKPYYVEPSDAFLHHYRKCITEFDPKMNCQIFTHDESLSRHIPTLRHNVHHTLWALKELENMRRSQGEAPQVGIARSHGQSL